MDFGLTESTVKTSKLSLKQTRALEKQIKNDVLLKALTAYLRVIQSRKRKICQAISSEYKKTNRT